MSRAPTRWARGTPPLFQRLCARLAGALFILTFSLAAGAQPAVPADAAAWVYVDAARLGAATDGPAQRAVVASLFDALGADRVIRDATMERAMRALFAEALVHGLPVSLCVLSIAEEEGAPSGPLRTPRFHAVVSIRTGDAHDAVAAALSDALGADAAVRTPLTIPGQKAAVQYQRREWPESRSITWSEGRGRIDVGFSAGEQEEEGASLARWLALGERMDPAAPISRHRRASGGAAPLFELFVDLNQLRRSFPDRFGDDAGARVLAALHLANARSIMVQASARKGGTDRSFDLRATWSLRSEPPDAIRRLDVVHAPPRGAAPDANWCGGFTPRFLEWTNGALDVYAAALGARDAAAFGRSRRAWAARRLAVLSRLQGDLGADARITLDRTASGCSFGAILLRFPIRDGVRPESVTRDLRTLLDPFADHISTDDQTWTFRLLPAPEQPSLIRAMTWGVVPRGDARELIIGVDLGVTNDWIWRSAAGER